jgi:hypothetical protein
MSVDQPRTVDSDNNKFVAAILATKANAGDASPAAYVRVYHQILEELKKPYKKS